MTREEVEERFSNASKFYTEYCSNKSIGDGYKKAFPHYWKMVKTIQEELAKVSEDKETELVLLGEINHVVSDATRDLRRKIWHEDIE